MSHSVPADGGGVGVVVVVVLVVVFVVGGGGGVSVVVTLAPKMAKNSRHTKLSTSVLQLSN